MHGRPGLVVHDEGWHGDRRSPGELRLTGGVRLRAAGRRSVVVRQVEARVRLLSGGALEGVAVRAGVHPRFPGAPGRADGHWRAQVVGPGGSGRPGDRSAPGHRVEVVGDVAGPAAALDEVYAAGIELGLVVDGADGRWSLRHRAVVPLSFPDADRDLPGGPPWRPAAPPGTRVRPLRTHLLGPCDDPVEVVRRYAVPHARAGDVVAIGESPLAIMQGRFRDPRQLRPGWAATRLCQFLSGEGSLGTAGGMAVLMEELGARRVTAGLLVGLAGKAIGRDGWFYRVAGPESRLVDDVTGSLPPYDRDVVSGPRHAGEVCAAVMAATGLAAVVVDANDLGFVDVVGAAAGVPKQLVVEALRANPAGNAAETTPLVLIRPPAGAVAPQG